jgi:GNAT superfamily N-acetyltransferase
VDFRVSTPADVETIVDVLTTAFFDDPLWGPAFPDIAARPRQAAALWRLLTRSAQRYDWVWVPDAVDAVAVWIPPGGVELTDAEEDGLEAYLTEACGADVAAGLLGIFAAFEAAHPREPHFYLSLLGTHASRRGRGIGTALLQHVLTLVDAERMPAYLESCNPVNDPLYRRHGFEPSGRFVVPSGHVVTTMWRPARAGAA